jgi:type IX secretion system PorP/SprF family membrane protein
MKKLLKYVFFLFMPLFAGAQQDTQFSQYMFNQLFLNPATAGMNTRDIEFNMIHRSQWAGYSGSFDQGGAPTTQIASVSMPIAKYKLGVGFHVVNDQLGAQTNQEAQLSMAYHIRLKRSKISMGIRGGIYNHVLDFDRLRFVDDTDPLRNTGKQNEFSADFAAGIYFRPDNEKFFVGASLNHINQTEFNYGTDISYNSLTQHMNLIGGLNIDLSRDIVLSPSFIVKSDMNSFSWEASAITTFNRKFYGGISMREIEAAIVLVGVNLMKDGRMRIGYAFDYTMQARNAKETTSHEIMIGYRLPGAQMFEPSIIRTPRYRHD